MRKHISIKITIFIEDTLIMKLYEQLRDLLQRWSIAETYTILIETNQKTAPEDHETNP